MTQKNPATETAAGFYIHTLISVSDADLSVAPAAALESDDSVEDYVPAVGLVGLVGVAPADWLLM